MSASTWPSNSFRSMMLPLRSEDRASAQEHAPRRRALSTSHSSRRVRPHYQQLGYGRPAGRRAASLIRRWRAQRGRDPAAWAQRTLDGFGNVAAQQHRAGELGEDGDAGGAAIRERARGAAGRKRVGCGGAATHARVASALSRSRHAAAVAAQHGGAARHAPISLAPVAKASAAANTRPATKMKVYWCGATTRNASAMAAVAEARARARRLACHGA